MISAILISHTCLAYWMTFLVMLSYYRCLRDTWQLVRNLSRFSERSCLCHIFHSEMEVYFYPDLYFKEHIPKALVTWEGLIPAILLFLTWILKWIKESRLKRLRCYSSGLSYPLWSKEPLKESIRWFGLGRSRGHTLNGSADRLQNQLKHV